jgi:hypothetical protein
VASELRKRIFQGTPTMSPVGSEPGLKGSRTTTDNDAAGSAEPRAFPVSAPASQSANSRDDKWRGDWQLPLVAVALIVILAVVVLVLHK